MGYPGPSGGFGIDFVSCVPLPVNVEVEPDVEEVLVVHSLDARGDERPVFGLLTRRDGGGGEDARRGAEGDMIDVKSGVTTAAFTATGCLNDNGDGFD